MDIKFEFDRKNVEMFLLKQTKLNKAINKTTESNFLLRRKKSTHPRTKTRLNITGQTAKDKHNAGLTQSQYCPLFATKQGNKKKRLQLDSL